MVGQPLPYRFGIKAKFIMNDPGGYLVHPEGADGAIVIKPMQIADFIPRQGSPIVLMFECNYQLGQRQQFGQSRPTVSTRLLCIEESVEPLKTVPKSA